MRIPRHIRTSCAVFMALFLSNIPALAMAEGSQMISTSLVVADLSRAQAEEKVQRYLTETDVRNELQKRGVSPDEVSQRLASLSDSELRQLSGQVEQARAGGDILFTILIVVLIIFLIKRI